MSVLLQLQADLAALLGAHAYFSGAPVLTEKVADLEHTIAKRILEAGGFGLVVTTAKGELSGDRSQHLLLRETLTVAIIHKPILAKAKNALEAAEEVIAAIHGAQTAGAHWRVLGHEHIPEAPAGTHVHHVHLETALKFA